MINRLLRNRLLETQKNILLLGPRQTGKSTLLGSLSPTLTINLIHEPTYLSFASNPNELESRLASLNRFDHADTPSVLIDEVQRLPSLLNTIQYLIDGEKQLRFLLSGSSARKLKRGGANLLPGRVLTYGLGPLVAGELNYELPTLRALALGSLPGILTETDEELAAKLLRSYAATYLTEEIQAESLTRNLEGFARFLKIAAGWSGHFLDLAKMAQASQVARQSVVRWFEILEDTLVVQRVDAFSKKLSKRLVRHPKFYFFDVGVLNGLLGNFEPSSDRIGLLFEHLIHSQLRYSAQARDQELTIATYRTEQGVEVDFVVELGSALYAIEAKASQTVGPHDLRHLRNFRDYAAPHRSMVWYLGKERKEIDKIEIIPWQDGLREMGL